MNFTFLFFIPFPACANLPHSFSTPFPLTSTQGLPKQRFFHQSFQVSKGEEAAGKGWLNPCVLPFKPGDVQLSKGEEAGEGVVKPL